MGISKRELMEDYYPAELNAVILAWNSKQPGAADADEETVRMSAADFLGGGGEIL